MATRSTEETPFFWELFPLDLKLYIASFLSPEDKVSLAMTSKAAAEDILGNNCYWKDIVYRDGSNLMSFGSEDKPEWKFDSLTMVMRCPLDAPEGLSQRAKRSVLWCGRLKPLLVGLGRANHYEGPTQPLNLSKKGLIASLLEALDDANERDGTKWSSKTALAFAQGRATGKLPDGLVAFPCVVLRHIARRRSISRGTTLTAFLDSEVYPGVPSVRLVNRKGWNTDDRSREFDGDAAALGLNEDALQDGNSWRGFKVEPASWYTDFKTEATIPAPVTLRKLFLALLQLKSGRNDWYYEMLTGAKVEAAEDRSLTITLGFDHGS